jgi:integrating conjugative element relaxase (TIGR03760 family)
MKTGIYAKLKWLRRPDSRQKTPPEIPLPTVQNQTPDRLWPKSAQVLLSTPERKQQLQQLWQRTALPRPLFDELHLQPISRFALLVQQLPASENHHHAYPGGLLDHTLEMMVIAARMRQSHLLPVGAAPEDQARETEAWSAAVIYAALLHDTGKVVTDMEIETDDGRRWYPWEAPLSRPYRLRFRPSRDYHLHPVVGSLLCLQILPATALNWLAQYPALFSAFLYCISGHHDKAGVLGELVQNADRASVAQNMGGDARQALARPQTSLAGQITTAVRELVSTQLTLNNHKSGSDGWFTAEALWLISKTAADKIRAWLLQQGISGIPDSNSRLFDEMQSYGLIVPSPEGKAIWHCSVAAASGWTPGCPLTLLRFAPEFIWPDLTSRPVFFEGDVTPVRGPPEQETSVATSLPADKTPDLSDIALSLFTADNTPAVSPRLPEVDLLRTAATTAEAPATAAAIRIPKRTTTTGNSGDTPDALQSATHFVHWLRQALTDRSLAVNEARAPVHMVDGAVLLVSPEIFKRYIKFTSGQTGEEWRQLQKDFQRLQLHRRSNDGINIWTIEVRGPRKVCKVKGFLLDNPREIFGPAVPEDNPYLSVVM